MSHEMVSQSQIFDRVIMTKAFVVKAKALAS